MTEGAGVAELPLVRPVSMRAFSKPDVGRVSVCVLGCLLVEERLGRLKDIICALKSVVSFGGLLQKVRCFFQEDLEQAFRTVP
jgi:hypothetical protein